MEQVQWPRFRAMPGFPWRINETSPSRIASCKASTSAGVSLSGMGPRALRSLDPVGIDTGRRCAHVRPPGHHFGMLRLDLVDLGLKLRIVRSR